MEITGRANNILGDVGSGNSHRDGSATKDTPKGAVPSPLLANVYFHPLNLFAQSQGWRMTR
ncbi:MAG TPA: hypothetical protein DCE44_06970 [Verrucomicrobiales bacterium]|nr:hypothetical protein [Verrucomicrobiales bacterium]